MGGQHLKTADPSIYVTEGRLRIRGSCLAFSFFRRVTIVLELYRRKWQGGNMYRDGELICPPPPGCQAYTHPQLISDLNQNKIKLISTLCTQKLLC